MSNFEVILKCLVTTLNIVQKIAFTVIFRTIKLPFVPLLFIKYLATAVFSQGKLLVRKCQKYRKLQRFPVDYSRKKIKAFFRKKEVRTFRFKTNTPGKYFY